MQWKCLTRPQLHNRTKHTNNLASLVTEVRLFFFSFIKQTLLHAHAAHSSHATHTAHATTARQC